MGVEQINGIAQTEVERLIIRGKNNPFNKSVSDILSAELPSIKDKDGYQTRVCLFVWLRILKDEYTKRDKIDPSQYRDEHLALLEKIIEHFAQVKKRIDEIERVLVGESIIAESDKKNKHEFKEWLYEKWLENDKPGGADFFKILGKYKGEDDSPIIGHYETDSSSELEWTLGCKDGRMTKKTIQNIVGKFKKI